MPYRYFLVPLIVSTILYFIWVGYSDTELNAWALVAIACSVVGIFIFQHQINNWWWRFYPPKLEPGEKEWIKLHLPYFSQIPERFHAEFFRELAKKCLNQEFISMTKQPVHEEWKWMAIGPAIALRLYQFDKIFEHYIRTAFYPHPFISPDHPNIHISETHTEDGIMIFSTENLIQVHFKAQTFLNPALYEWAKVAANELKIVCPLEKTEIQHLITQYLGKTDFQDIIEWMGYKDLDVNALCLYLYIMEKDLLPLRAQEKIRDVLF